MNRLLPAADGRPTMGVEIELAIFRHGQPTGEASILPSRLIAAAQSRLATLPRIGRSGVFTCAGLFYHEMHRFLEAASWPSADLPSVLRLEDAVLAEARELFLASGLDVEQHHMACYPDDLSGCPLALAGRSKRGQRPSASMGTHINLVVPCGAENAHELVILLASALPEIVGPGGFVQVPDGIEFWRDPRSAHVRDRGARAAHDQCRPILKLTDEPHRLQVVSLGYTASRVDRTIKYGLLLLLACHAAAGRAAPRFRVSRPYHLLHAPPGRTVAYQRSGHVRRTTRLEILKMLIDEVLEPTARTAFGQAARCEDAIDRARAVIAALETAHDPAAVALTVPTSWALKHHVFERYLESSGQHLPTRRWRAPAPAVADLEDLAVLAILEADVLHDKARNFFLTYVDGTPWSYDQVYGADREGLAAVRERRLPPGAAPPGAEIVGNLLHADNKPKGFQVGADWSGVTRMPSERAGAETASARIVPEASAAEVESLLQRLLSRCRRRA